MSIRQTQTSQLVPGLLAHAYRVLTTASPQEKAQLTQEAFSNWDKNHELGSGANPPDKPARPPRPEIVSKEEMPSPKTSPYGINIFYLHSLAHVELNAIDLCFDTMLRFPSTKQSWYEDWISIAADEARHFTWLSSRLVALGYEYGSLPAHDNLWQGIDASAIGCKERLALGQLVAEARGLDAGPKIANRLMGSGDKESSNIVAQIAEEELRHVKIGVKWFIHECENEGRDPIKEFHNIALRFSNPGAFAPPFNEQRRRQAGLDPEWYLPVAEETNAQVRRKREEGKLSKVVTVDTRAS